jgi:hypothetical protein
MKYHKLIVADQLKREEVQVVNDKVMGGSSRAQVESHHEGIRFYGQVSLANNGGFASFRIPLQLRNISAFSAFLIKLEGDGKTYQFRVQEHQQQRHAYVADINTTGQLQEIKISFDELKPRFRGNRLDLPCFNGQTLSRLGLMILPGKELEFNLIFKEVCLI